MKESTKKALLLVAVSTVLVQSCATHRKLQRLKDNESPSVQLVLGKQNDFLPTVNEGESVTRDTLKVKDEDGRELLIMKAIKDEESGDMVATEQLDAAMVTARFRNVAERNGQVDLAFQIIVPSSMRDSKWQLRFNPDMYVMEDSIRLDPLIITGEQYRKAQLKGYQQYDRFISRIVEDSTKLINIRLLEVFLERNIPQVYQFKSDSSYVSDEEFLSYYGVSEKQAVDHYTNRFLTNMNDRRIAKKDRMYRKYLKAPIVTEGIRLDTVLVDDNGDFIYNYIQTINTRPKLRKVDIVISGEIYEQDKRLYRIPRTEPLTFYISSISAFVDSTERYLTKVVERRATANTESRIDFELGKADVLLNYNNNLAEITFTQRTMASLIENEIFDIDSIIVRATASPEGSYSTNSSLAQRRSESVSKFFTSYIKEYSDSVIQDRGTFAMIGEDNFSDSSNKLGKIKLTPRSIPENWDDLGELVKTDIVMNDGQKEQYFAICRQFNDPDRREAELRKCAFYNYMKETLYPRLRVVKFNFYLHRKGMVKDTVHTTVIDQNYMDGVAALRDSDYATAFALLASYKDFNAAVACMGMERNATAMEILQSLPVNDKINYLLAILYSRSGEYEKAVEHYLIACKQNPSYVFRGNLDPEISVLVKMYNLNSYEDDEVFF